jgi:ribosomal protein S18 acetylase RimI-like enzyme
VIEPVAIGPDELLRRRREVERLWNDVWPGTPRERFDDILPRHAGRQGFRAVIADDEAGQLVGLAYGYTGAPGQWWHDIVSAGMGEEAAARWLGPGHFELVELMVAPAARGHGLGGRLHDSIVGGLAATTAVLSTQTDNEPALALYRRRGWELVVPEIRFAPDGDRYCVLGIDLGREAGQ